MARLGAVGSDAKLGAAIVAVVCASCTLPVSETTVSVDTDVRTPQLADRLRMDVFSGDRCLDQREISLKSAKLSGLGDPAAPDAAALSGAAELSERQVLPVSFALTSESARRDVLVRLRLFSGDVASTLGEAVSSLPALPPREYSQLCTQPPNLRLNIARPLRGSGQPSAAAPQLTCTDSVASGLAGGRLEIEQAGTYRIEVTAATPAERWSAYADTLLFIGRTCDSFEPLACNDNAPSDAPPRLRSLLSAMDVTLEPGTYTVLVGNSLATPFEATLLVRHVDDNGDVPEVAPLPLPADDRVVWPCSTGEAEPDPRSTIDRLLQVRVGQVQLTFEALLHGECFGAAADLERLRSCMEDPALPRSAVTPPMSAPATGPSTVQTWGADDSCTGWASPPLDDDAARACVPGGAFLLGDTGALAFGPDSASPVLPARLDAFTMDRYEYSVGRYRSLLRRGFSPPDDGPVEAKEAISPDATRLAAMYCSWNQAPDGGAQFPAQEELPLNCVSWATARAACQFDGGDLPTVAQHEFASAAAGKATKSTYPLGANAPDCGQAVYGRWSEATRGNDECRASGFGLQSIRSGANLSDRTPTDVTALGGNVSEWTLDSHRRYDHSCWVGPYRLACNEDEAPLRTVKGGSWRQARSLTRTSTRLGAPPIAKDDAVGFRCVYPLSPPRGVR